jgi:hypothetical protein
MSSRRLSPRPAVGCEDICRTHLAQYSSVQYCEGAIGRIRLSKTFQLPPQNPEHKPMQELGIACLQFYSRVIALLDGERTNETLFVERSTGPVE